MWNSKKNNPASIIPLTVLISLLAVFTIAKAGSLSPTADPAATSYTLEDIYNRINTNTTATVGNHVLSTTTSPVASFYTLTQIYDAIPTIDTEKVLTGTSYLGTAGTWDASNLTNALVKLGTTYSTSSTGTLTPDGGTASVADLFLSTTAHLTGDWSLDTGTLTIACATSTFDGTSNLVGDTYDGDGDGSNRWCMTGSGDAVASSIWSGKIGWVDGQAITGTVDVYTYGDNTASKVLTTATAAGTYDASNLSVGTVKSGTTFDTASTGDYPSATYPLSNADGTTDLAGDGSNMTSSNEAVEWWQSDGTRQTATLDFPTISNVCDSDTSNGTTGTLTIDATLVASSTSYCGTLGTLGGNMFMGTGQSFTGGTQDDGGVDDYNNGGTPPSDRYATSWTQCDVDNSYCGTGLTSAVAKDNATGLIWSGFCDGVGCASFSASAIGVTTYSQSNVGVNNDSKTGMQLCTSGNHGESGWFLPSQKQVLQAYVDGYYGNVSLPGEYFALWTATLKSTGLTSAWMLNTSVGWSTYVAASSLATITCVR